MDNDQEVTELLRSQNIEYRVHGDELLTHCIFNDCDVDSRGNEAHLYINKVTGAYDCKSVVRMVAWQCSSSTSA